MEKRDGSRRGPTPPWSRRRNRVDMPSRALLAQLRAARVVPVIRTRTRASAATAVQWLFDAGLRIFEITMTIPEAPALIREFAADASLLLGAGTVPDRASAQECL